MMAAVVVVMVVVVPMMHTGNKQEALIYLTIVLKMERHRMVCIRPAPFLSSRETSVCYFLQYAHGTVQVVRV